MRRKTLLRGPSYKMIAPASGTVWFPNPRERSLCESFIVMVAAEIETYLEAIVMRALDAYMAGQTEGFTSRCTATSEFCAKVMTKKNKWANNHNTSWARVSDTFEFIGLPQSVFPAGLWDEIDAITHERGSIVHQSVGLRQITDPRGMFARIDRFVASLKTFDQAYQKWISAVETEVVRLRAHPISFPAV